MPSTTTTHYVAAAALLERLLTDAAFRAAFQADPAAVCRAHSLEHLAAEFEQADGPTALDPRESHSALAGILLAAAAEGAAMLEFFADGDAGAGDAVALLERALAADPQAMPAVGHAR